MDPEHLNRLQRLFSAAHALAPHEREAFLDDACADDPALHRELASLLASHDVAEARAFLDAPLLDLEQVAAPADEPPDRRIGPYRILRELGHGGMGVVYLAERDDIEKRVALKLVHRYLASSETVQRFLFERRILARLEHPHIARLLDAGTMDDGTPYFAMEYVEGETLTAYCDHRRRTVAERLALFQEVCEAVRYAHQNLIIHRDLKPSNILVTEEEGTPQVKLLDFGIAKLVEPEAEGLTRTGMRAMTPAYAAPEQVRGGPVTTATDVYALGVLLYALLAGQRPYDVGGRTPGEVERMICETVPVKPSTAVRRVHERLRADGTMETTTPEAVSAARSTEPARLHRRLRGDLDMICMKALAKESAQRYASAEAFLEDLKRHGGGLPVAARPSTVGYRVRKFVARHRTGVATAVVTVGLVAVLVGFYTWQLATERNRVEQELAKSETVTAFLMNLFEAGDPREALGDTLTVYDLLDRGAARAEALADEPLVQAQMLDVVGRVYEGLGEYEPAQPLLEQALALRREALDPTHPDVAQSLDHIAGLLASKGDYAAAEPLVREALATRRAVLGEAHPDVASSLNTLASLLQAKGNYDEAEPLFRQVLAIRQRLLGAEHFDTVTSMNNLALLLHLKGNYDEAETLYRKVVTIDRATLGEAHPDMATDLLNLATLLVDRGSYDEAETLYQEALAMCRKTLGDEHPRVANVLKGLTALLVKQERYDEAGQHLRQSLAINRAKRGEAHPYTLSDQGSLGMLRYRQGDPAAAEALLRQTLTSYREHLGAEHPRLAYAMVSLAEVLTAQGDYAAAERYYREALAMQQKLLQPGHLDITTTLRGLAALQAAQGDYAAAELHYRQALALQRQRLNLNHPDLAATLNRLAAVLTEQGTYAVAEPLYQEALAIYRDRLGETHRWTQDVRNGLRDLYEAWGKPEQAARY